MKYHIDRTESYSIASITQNKSEVVMVHITVDTHQNNTVLDQTVESLYPEALFSGAGKYTRPEFLNALNLLGASVTVSIANNIVTFTIRSIGDNFKKVLSLTENLFINPLFPKTELARIHKTTINKLHEAKENSQAIAHEVLQTTLYEKGDRRHSFSIDETIKHVPSVTSQELKTFHKRVTQAYWTCSIAGDKSQISNFQTFVSKIKKDVPKTEKLEMVHKQKSPQKKAVLKNIPSRQNIDFSIGAPVPITLHHPDFIPLNFAIAVLGKWGGFAGRLMSTVREQEGLTYGIYAKLEGFKGTEQGYWRIITFFSPEKTIEALTSTFREIKKLYLNGIAADELKRFKTILGTQQALLQDSIGSQLNDLHIYHCHNFTLEEMRDHKHRTQLLTEDEVNSAIKKYLNPELLTISGAGPIKAVQKDIQKFINSV